MRKLLFALILIIAASCGTETNDKKIETAFKDYVNFNFDDPNKLKEIVGVTYGDTLTNKSFAKMLDELTIMYDSITKMKSVSADKAVEFANNNGKKVNKNLAFLVDWKDFQESLKNNMNKRWEYVSTIMSGNFVLQDSILKYKDFALVDFKVKYRILEGESLKLKEQQGYYDLKSSDVFWDISANDSLSNFLKAINNSIDYYKSMIEIDSDVLEKSQKVISYFE